MEKSEKLLELEKSIKDELDRIACEEDVENLLEYTELFVNEKLEEILKELLPQIEKLHEFEPPRLTMADKMFFSRDRRKRKTKSSKLHKRFTAIHYTSTNTLISMFQNAVGKKEDYLRMYDSVHLNDPDEGNYIVRDLQRSYQWLENKKESHAYIASFIAPERVMSNDLKFWRMYGEEGEGCSLALRVPSERLKKVLYGTEVSKIACVLHPILDVLDNLAKKDKDIGAMLSGIIWKFLERFRYLYKSEAYKHEKEYRIVLPESEVGNKDKIHFEPVEGESAPSRVRHYYQDKDLEIKNLFDNDSLITLGPSIPNPYNMKYYLDALMRKAKLQGPEIRISKTPYRKS